MNDNKASAKDLGLTHKEKIDVNSLGLTSQGYPGKKNQNPVGGKPHSHSKGGMKGY